VVGVDLDVVEGFCGVAVAGCLGVVAVGEEGVAAAGGGWLWDVGLGFEIEGGVGEADGFGGRDLAGGLCAGRGRLCGLGVGEVGGERWVVGGGEGGGCCWRGEAMELGG